jgi:hypothetical protein
MKGRRGKVVSWSCLVGGVVVLGLCLFAFRERILEEWYIYRLGSDDQAVRLVAAEWLGEKKSLRAVPKLVGLICGDEREQAFRMLPTRRSGETGWRRRRLFTPLAYSLYLIGPNAMPLVKQALPAHARTESNRNVLENILDAWAERSDDVSRMTYEEASETIQSWTQPTLTF